MSTIEDTGFASVESLEVHECRAALMDGTFGTPDVDLLIEGSTAKVVWTWSGGPFAGVQDSAWHPVSNLIAMHLCPWPLRVLGFDAEKKLWLIKRDGYAPVEVSHGSGV